MNVSVKRSTKRSNMLKKSLKNEETILTFVATGFVQFSKEQFVNAESLTSCNLLRITNVLCTALLLLCECLQWQTNRGCIYHVSQEMNAHCAELW